MGAVYRTFGQKLRAERTKRGLKQKALAERAGLSKRGLQTISDLERGKFQPSQAMAERIAAAMGLRGSDLAADAGNTDTPGANQRNREDATENARTRIIAQVMACTLEQLAASEEEIKGFIFERTRQRAGEKTSGQEPERHRS